MTINIPEGLRRDALLNGRTELYARLGKLARYGGRSADVDERLADLYTAIIEINRRVALLDEPMFEVPLRKPSKKGRSRWTVIGGSQEVLR